VREQRRPPLRLDPGHRLLRTQPRLNSLGEKETDDLALARGDLLANQDHRVATLGVHPLPQLQGAADLVVVSDGLNANGPLPAARGTLRQGNRGIARDLRVAMQVDAHRLHHRGLRRARVVPSCSRDLAAHRSLAPPHSRSGAIPHFRARCVASVWRGHPGGRVGCLPAEGQDLMSRAVDRWERTNFEAPATVPIAAHRARALRRAAGALGLIAAGIGVLTLAGWLLGAPALTSLVPTAGATKANASVSLLLIGVSLWLLSDPDRRRTLRMVGKLLAFVAALTGVLTLGEYFFGWDLRIDQLLFRELPGAPLTSHPGRMAPITALGLLLLGTALLLLDGEIRVRALAPWLALITAFTAIFALATHAFVVGEVFAGASYTVMALPTAIATLLLAVGILLARPEHRLVAMAGACCRRR
jgi:hypothetical protein